MGAWQRGYVYKAFGAWHVRYRENQLQPDGSVKRMQVSKRVGSLAAYRTKTEARLAARETVEGANRADQTQDGSMTLEQFADRQYIPYAKRQLRPSTWSVYESVWTNHLKTRVGEVRVREFRTYHGEQLMAELADKTGMRRSSLTKVKNVLSAMFVYAKRSGRLDGINPMQGVSIPRTARESEDTHAYSLEEITRMLMVLPPRDAALVGLAGFAGLRRGEIRGLWWESYDGKTVQVRQSMWQDFLTEPKTAKAKAAVPVIARLKKLLDCYHDLCGNPAAGPMFVGIKKGKALHIDNVGNLEIAPRLKKLGIEWHGWHALRRGLSSNLYRLGVPDKTIQAILRHANVATTQKHYIKTTPEDTLAAMKRLETAVKQTGKSVQ